MYPDKFIFLAAFRFSSYSWSAFDAVNSRNNEFDWLQGAYHKHQDQYDLGWAQRPHRLGPQWLTRNGVLFTSRQPSRPRSTPKGDFQAGASVRTWTYETQLLCIDVFQHPKNPYCIWIMITITEGSFISKIQMATSNKINHRGLHLLFEGSLEVKLPTIWTNGKSTGERSQRREEQKREDQRRERVRGRKMQVGEKVGTSRNSNDLWRGSVKK